MANGHVRDRVQNYLRSRSRLEGCAFVRDDDDVWGRT